MLSLPPLGSAPQAFLREPDIHMNQAAFICEGDLWIGSIETGEARRLTRSEGVEGYPRFSPDGRSIAYTAEYDGVREVYVISVEGGAPTRTTFRHDYAEPLGWSSKGEVLFRSRSLPRSYGLFTAPAGGGPETRLPVEFASHGDLSSDGRLAFTRFNRWSDAWFRYEGGMANQIWIGDLAQKRFQKVTDLPGTCEFPVWAGSEVAFVQEKEGRFAIHAVPGQGGRARRLTEASEFEIRELNAGPGALIYERGLGLEMIDLKSGTVKPLRFRLDSDLAFTRPFQATAARFAAAMGMTPTGQRVLAEARGQIVSLPAGEGEARLWKAEPGARLRMPLPSPKGGRIAYTSDASGEVQIMVADAEGRNPRAITQRAGGQIMSMSWSPDGGRIAYYDSSMRLNVVDVSSGRSQEVVWSRGKNWFECPHSWSPDGEWLAFTQYDGVTDYGRIAIRHLDSGREAVIGHPLAHNDFPAFSRDGRYLAYLSRRSFSAAWDPIQNQMNAGPAWLPVAVMLRADEDHPLALKDAAEPAEAAKKPDPEAGFRIDLDGLEARSFPLPVKPSNAAQAAFAGDRLLWGADGAVRFFDFKSKQEGVVASGSTFEVSADGKRVRIGDRVIDAASVDAPAAKGRLDWGGLRLEIDPRKEWEQMYWDAWRLLRDFFYAANMHGLDWPEIGAKYSALLPAVRSRDELDILIRMLQAELGSSHQYLSAGDERSSFPRTAGAFLGIDVEPDPAANRLRIVRIMRGDGLDPAEMSPLLQAGFAVKEGDYLVGLAGQELTAKDSYLSIIAGRAGQAVSVAVASQADGSDRREIIVKPVAQERRMRLLDWVQSRRRMVEELSGGRLGYIYLQAMGEQDVQDFMRQYYPQRSKQALIVDTRFNNGGNTQSIINRVLVEKVSGYFNLRSSEFPWSRQGDAFLGPVAVLMNEFNVSCGEEFPHRFRDLGRGPLIGRRTYGGEVGSSPGWPLADGGIVSVPNYGMFTPDGKWVIEGPGVAPDIDVESDPNLFAAGRDAQLERAVEWLIEALRKAPTAFPKQPAEPAKFKGGGL
jgi:tricorn protease